MKNAHTANDTGLNNNTKYSVNYNTKIANLSPDEIISIKQRLTPKRSAMLSAVHSEQGIPTHEICQGAYMNNAPDVARKANVRLKFFGLKLKCFPPIQKTKDTQQSWCWFLLEVDK